MSRVVVTDTVVSVIDENGEEEVNFRPGHVPAYSLQVKFHDLVTGKIVTARLPGTLEIVRE